MAFLANGVTAQDVMAMTFPVGSVYVSVIDTNPAVLLGFGTWVAFSTGRCLVGFDAGNPNFNAPEKTGGAEDKSISAHAGAAVSAHTGTAVAQHVSHTHDVTPNVSVDAHPAHTHSVTPNVSVNDHASHTHSVTPNVSVNDHASHTHQYTEVPNHTHPHSMQGGTTGSNSGTNVMGSTATGGSARAMAIATSNPSGGVATGTTQGPGAALTHTVNNPAVTSAGPGATLTHTVNNPAVTSGNPSASLTHTVNNPAVTSGGPSASLTHDVTQPSDHDVTQPDNHADVNVLQPYVVVFFWKRTA